MAEEVEMKGKKILVTGGEGFVGSHLCDVLGQENSVYSLDNRLMPRHFYRANWVKYFYGSCQDIFQFFPNENFDVIFHLGEYSRVEQSMDEPMIALQSIKNGIIPVIEYCRANNVKLIYSGSSTKFSSDKSGKSLSPYTFAKSCNTELVQKYIDWYGVDAAIVYFYNVYGDREQVLDRYATVVAKFLALKKKNVKYAPITLPGTQERNFTHVLDIISGLIVVAEKGHGDGYGIGSDESYSILDLAKMIGLEPSYTPSVSSNRHDAELVTSKTKELGWRCRYKLDRYIMESLM